MISGRLNNLEENPSNKTLSLILILSIIGCIIIFLLMRPIEIELKNMSTFGVMELEFAWTLEQINIIFDSWGSELIYKELTATLLDFVFLCTYSTAFSCLTLLITRNLPPGRIQNLGYYLTFLPFLAAIFDAIENLNLIFMMLSYPSLNIPTFIPFLASGFALMKFGLLIIVLLFWVFCLARLLIVKVSSK